MATAAGDRVRHFSMIRGFHLADFFTLANAASGVASIFAAISFVESAQMVHFYVAAALLPVALAFDILDGRIARWRQRTSSLGRELDSLSDVISFGVGPAVLAFAAGMRGTWDRAVLIYFVACGVSRLARFNVTAEELSTGTDKVKYFEGTPIPTSVVLVGLVTFAASQNAIGSNLWFGAVSIGGHTLHPLALLFLVSGTLMISRIRIPKI